MRDVLSADAVRRIKRLGAGHGARNVRVLGSIREDSPGHTGRVVFLVDMDKGRSLFDLVALSEELREALGVKVDVLTEGSLSPYLRDTILVEAVAL